MRVTFGAGMIFSNIEYLRHKETQTIFVAMVDKKEKKSSASPFFHGGV